MKADWQTKSLGEILLKTETVNPAATPEDEFEYIDVSSVSNETYEIEETQLLNGKDAPSRARRLVKAGDVIFATIRPTLQRIARVPASLDGQICSTGYFVMRPSPELDAQYLFYSLFSEQFMSGMESLQKGASYPAVTDAEVRSQQISYPAIQEQRRIVTLLDEAFADIATAKANAEKNLQNAHEIFSTQLHVVFGETAKDWIKTTIGEHIRFIDYRGKTPIKTSQGLRLITAKNVKMGFIQKTPEEFVAPDSYDSWMTRGIPNKGDVLFTTEAPLANVAQLDTDEKVVFAQRIIIMQPNRQKLDPIFLKFLLLSPPTQQRIKDQGTGATVQGIKASLLKKIEISFPAALNMQTSIVEQLESLSEEVDRLESIYRQKLSALDDLKKSLLHQAFSGLL